MQIRLLSLSLVLVCIIGESLSSSASASNWPRFRGPNGTGVSTDKEVPVSWDASGVLWQAPLPGSGNSSPIVWDGKVFLETASSDGGKRQLLCLGLADGKVIWEKSAPGKTAKTHKKNSLASCTVATDGVRIYTPFWDGSKLSLAAYDFTGKELWSHTFGDYVSQHGPGHSPVLFDGKVIFSYDQDGAASLVALNAETGKVVWTTPRPPHRTCYSTPFLLERPDAPTELVVASTQGISGIDAKTGKEDWKWDWTGNGLRTVASPLFDKGMLFATGGDGGGSRHAVAVKLESKGTTAETTLAWEDRRTFPYVPTMLTLGDYLFFVNDRGVAACHIAKTGENVWTNRLGGNVSASPILVDGKIYSVSEDGEVFVFAAEPTFKLLGKSSLGETVLSSPAVADNRLLIRGDKHLFCIGKPAK